MTYANKPVSSTSRRRAIVKRLAGFGAASFAAALVAAPMSHAVGSPAPASDTSTDTGTPGDAGTPSTDAPTTDAPSTDAPTADTPSTDATSAAAPSTDAPSTDAPSTHPPSSVAAEPAPAAPGGPARAAARPAPAVTVLDEAPTPTPTPSDAGDPVFGLQKLRVGVHLAPGDAAPDGYSLANATIQIAESGPGVGDASQAVPGVSNNGSIDAVRTCVTDATGFCPESFPALAAATPGAQDGATPARDIGGSTILEPGDSAVITQLTTPDGPGLRVDPQPQTVGPCTVPADAQIPICGFVQPVLVSAADTPGTQPQQITPQTPPLTCTQSPNECTLVLFDDPGLPPSAVNDHATVKAGEAVDIHVTVNDDLNDVPMTNLTSTGPAHGTVHRSGHVLRYTAGPTFGGVDTFKYTVSTANGSATATVKVTVKAPPVATDDTAQTTGGSGAPGDPITIPVLDNDKAEGAVITLASTTTPGHGTAAVDGLSIVYTPAADFFGVDSFSYTITTANGSSTGTITVTVAAPPAAPDALASTGSASGQLMGLGATLLVVGGGASVAGRRRRASA